MLDAAQVLLAQREHSQKQLRAKLLSKGYDLDAVEIAIGTLANSGLQCDKRYAENYMTQRSVKGYGPNYIRQYLGQQGISQSMMTALFEQIDIDWFNCIECVWRKKFSVLPQNLKEKAKQQQFLYYRGFESEQIQELFEILKYKSGL